MRKCMKVNLTTDEEVVKEAKAIGLNMSKIAENALKKAILALKKAETETNGGTLTNTTVFDALLKISGRGGI